jgi:hypothetical protein
MPHTRHPVPPCRSGPPSSRPTRIPATHSAAKPVREPQHDQREPDQTPKIRDRSSGGTAENMSLTRRDSVLPARHESPPKQAVNQTNKRKQKALYSASATPCSSSPSRRRRHLNTRARRRRSRPCRLPDGRPTYSTPVALSKQWAAAQHPRGSGWGAAMKR